MFFFLFCYFITIFINLYLSMFFFFFLHTFSFSGREYVGYEPIWFKKETDKITGNLIHMYKGNYWEYKDKQDWSMCPDIYLSSEELAAFKIS